MWFIYLFYFFLLSLSFLLIIFLINIVSFSNMKRLLYSNFYLNYLISCIGVSFFIFIFLLYYFFNFSFYINNFFFSNILIFPFIFIFIFVTLLSILFCISYNTNELLLFVFYCLFILFIGFNLFFSDYLIYFFLFYEMLLIPSFFILYKFAKTRRAVEAAYMMFFWTQFGAIFLIFSLFYLFFLTSSSSFLLISGFSFTTFDVNFLFICFFIGFGVKLPIWPFYGWLPKAHVEASTNFSIFLSGVLVKFAFFGLIRCLLLINLEPSIIFFIPILIIGIVDSSFKLFYQIDLKKIVAYSTVIEMHWLSLSLITGYSYLFIAGFCMLVSHAFLSTNFFFLVDCLNRRYKTRLITEVSSVSLTSPKLFLMVLVNLLIFLGFPGTLFFIAEVLFFSFVLDFMPILLIIFLVLLYLIVPTLFFKSWWVAMCGNSINLQKNLKLDLDSIELLLLSSITFILFWLGLSWQLFII